MVSPAMGTSNLALFSQLSGGTERKGSADAGSLVGRLNFVIRATTKESLEHTVRE